MPTRRGPGDGPTPGAGTDPWAALVHRYVDEHYGSLRGRVRTYVVDHHLREHLEPPPGRVVDVGGGAGHQSLPLARTGYEVTIVDPSPAMLDRARAELRAEAPEVAARVRTVNARGEEGPDALAGERFDAVLCHGVLPYLEDPAPLLDAVAALAGPGAVVSLVAKNVEALALFPAAQGDWAATLAAFDADRQVNALGVETRAHGVDEVAPLLSARGIEPLAAYGVRLFTDGWDYDRPPDDPEDLVLRAELEASRRDPYRRLSRLFHLVGVRR